MQFTRKYLASGNIGQNIVGLPVIWGSGETEEFEPESKEQLFKGTSEEQFKGRKRKHSTLITNKVDSEILELELDADCVDLNTIMGSGSLHVLDADPMSFSRIGYAQSCWLYTY